MSTGPPRHQKCQQTHCKSIEGPPEAVEGKQCIPHGLL